ncbi:type IV secretion system protein [Caulobacter sp. 73W]|uniref:Type IV secretion system protein n=1 Tax=Caulobacter sp. 73W TaxID=3161137 RepID=A0AB39KRH7_9CAUL
MKPTGVILATALAVCGVSPAKAAVIVHDPTAYLKVVEEVRAALDQLEALKAQLAEGKRLHDSLNVRSAIDAIAPELSKTELRKALPELDALRKAAGGQLEALGAIGDRAREIREARRGVGPALTDSERLLARDGDLAARDLAVGEAAIHASAERLEGLRHLQTAVGKAESARAVADLQARISAEQALILNDQMRLQAFALSQEAEERMRLQEAKERSAQRRRDRMDQAKRTFQ